MYKYLFQICFILYKKCDKYFLQFLFLYCCVIYTLIIFFHITNTLHCTEEIIGTFIYLLLVLVENKALYYQCLSSAHYFHSATSLVFIQVPVKCQLKRVVCGYGSQAINAMPYSLSVHIAAKVCNFHCSIKHY